MKAISLKYKIFILAVLLVGNAIIFYKRDSGFEFLKFSKLEELYPLEHDSSFVSKWAAYDKRFSVQDVQSGYKILVDSLGIDTVVAADKRIALISGWIFQLFAPQIGKPSLHIIHSSVLKQYEFYVSRKDQQLWCGNFQEMVGFFCTAAGLQNRYVEIAPINGGVSPPFHEVNEVYLPASRKWVMTDATRNLLLLKNKNQFLSAAEYYNYSLTQNKNEISFVTVKDSILITVPDSALQLQQDGYFNNEHFLRYYYTKDLAEVYSFKNRMQRYFLCKPWYEIYDPVRTHSNILFRVKQFVTFLTITIISFILFSLVQKRMTAGRNFNATNIGK